MPEHFSRLLSAIGQTSDLAAIADTTRGVEKESLRITPKGTLAQTAHQTMLGSALTHPHITTDYSEALLEFITDPQNNSRKVLDQLCQIHAYTYQHIDDEYLWVSSMPCVLGADQDIPIAQYGSSNSGHMKSVYREGLGHRYGRPMQTIAGIHYNFSVSETLWEFLRSQSPSSLSIKDFKTTGYFSLIRNFRRYFWLLLYLFGASPGVCKSFVSNRSHSLVPFNGDENSLYLPYATSLRMGDLGYQSSAQDDLIITYNCLPSYIQTLCCAITDTHPEYQKIGLQNNNGDYLQLNDGLLQIENEFYSVIRPKHTAKPGETALTALQNHGVEYIEVRCLDLNPYEPLGINEEQMNFLDVFLTGCLLMDSPQSSVEECHHIQINQKRTVSRGRDPELLLFDQGKERSMREWGKELLDTLQPVAQLMDKAAGTDAYSASLTMAQNRVSDASLTPSARTLQDMKEQELTFFRFAMNQSEKHHAYFQERFSKMQTDSPLTISHYENLAKQSLRKQREIEEKDTLSFDQYLKNYYDQYQCAQEDCVEKAVV